MRPVNLIPESSRPHRPSGRLGGSAYAIVGVLGILLVMAVAYVLATNDISKKQSEIAAAEAETQAANERAGSFTSFSNFAQIKDARQTTVRDLATVRFDWERLMREASHVIPSDIWLLDMSASTTPQDSSGAATAAAPAGETPSLNPTMGLNGCAKSQSSVAGLMVRLRKMDRVEDVELSESVRQDEGGDVATTDSAAGGESGCPSDRFKFTVTVTFTTLLPSEGQQQGAESVPTALGGGS